MARLVIRVMVLLAMAACAGERVFAQPAETDTAAKAKAAFVAYAAQIETARQAIEEGRPAKALEALAKTNAKLRGWEHAYLLGRAQKKQPRRRSLPGKGATVETVAFAGDSRRLLVGTSAKDVTIWDFRRNRSQWLKGHPIRAEVVAVSPDGKKFASGGWDGKVVVWDAATGKKLLEYNGHNLPNTPPGDHQTTTLRTICFSPNSKRIVSVAYGNNPLVRHLNSEVKVWSVETGKTLLTLKGKHTTSRAFFIVCATFGPNGKLIATGDFDNKIKLWDAQSGKKLREIAWHKNNVLGVAFSPNGKRLASASTDRSLAVWNVATGKRLLELKGHKGPVFDVVFSPDGKRIVSGCWDKTVRVWSAETGVELLKLGKLPGPIRTVAISRDGKSIAAGGGAPKRIADATVWSSAVDSGQPPR